MAAEEGHPSRRSLVRQECGGTALWGEGLRATGVTERAVVILYATSADQERILQSHSVWLLI